MLVCVENKAGKKKENEKNNRSNAFHFAWPVK